MAPINVLSIDAALKLKHVLYAKRYVKCASHVRTDLSEGFNAGTTRPVLFLIDFASVYPVKTTVSCVDSLEWDGTRHDPL